jgi:IS5 family transposase
VAGKLGAIAQGVEPSEYAAGVAGLNVFCGMLGDFAVQTDQKFDVIAPSHVIEHVPNPVEKLAAMKSLVAPGGLIWIGVPNAANPISRALKGYWHSADLPYRPMQFSPHGMAKAAELAGLKVSNREYSRHRRRVSRSLFPLSDKDIAATNLSHPLVRPSPTLIRREMNRQAAVEPVISHLKAEHRISRKDIKGRGGDWANRVLAATGFNFGPIAALVRTALMCPATDAQRRNRPAQRA